MTRTGDAKSGSRAPLMLLIGVEIAVFGFLGANFATPTNAAEIVRLAVEIGLLAIALTPIVVAGGIDLSLGSTLGLCAVLLGKLHRDVGLPIWIAASATPLLGAAAGALNGALIGKMRLPALIVTLGTMSLFRGIAEGITAGVDNFTGFDASFLNLGQGYLGGMPWQLPIFVIVALGYWIWLHRSVPGREAFAIGFAPASCRYAGVPVASRLMGLYVASGCVAGLAAVVYVAHLGQAKADAGTGYELLALTAAVLGGTSILGGRGSIAGTVLGLVAIAILQNGLRLSDLPSEMAGIATGGLLLAAIGWERLRANGIDSKLDLTAKEEFFLKNWQAIALCAAMLGAAALVAGSNRQLAQSVLDAAHSLRESAPQTSPTVGPQAASSTSPLPNGKKLLVAMMPKSKGNAYFIACRKGAEEAARELGVELLWDGPTDPDPARQNEIVDTWITRGVDVMAIAVENRAGVSSVLRKARDRGVKVLTWDSDAEADARDFFVNQATPAGIGNALMDNAARVLGGKGEFAIVTASLTAANMIEWQKHIEARRQAMYPNVKMAALRPCDDLQKKAFDETNAILAAHPRVTLVMAICSPGVPGAAEAVKQSGRKDVKVLGLGLPNDNKPFVHAGITDCVILWNTMDLGYLTIHAAHQLAKGELKPGATAMQAGRLKTLQIEGDNILLGKPFAFTKENIDQFDF